MTRQTDHTDVVSQILTTKLSTQTDLLSLNNQFLLEVDVTESSTGLITGGRQTIIELDRSQLHSEQVLLGRSTTNHEGDMIRRTSSCTPTLHLLYQEGDERTLILDGSLGHRIEVGLVGRATTLGHHHKLILSTLGSLDINLCRQVATGIHLVVHIQRCILRVAQIVLGKGVEHTQRECLLILETGPDLLTLLTMDDGGTRILAERQDTLGSGLCITQELQGDILVVLRGLRIGQDLSYLLIMLSAQHELHIVEGLLGQEGQGLLRNLYDLLTFKLGGCHAIFCQKAIRCFVFTHLKHRCVLKFNILCHTCTCFNL